MRVAGPVLAFAVVLILALGGAAAIQTQLDEQEINEDLEVTATVENIGDSEAETDVNLTVDDIGLVDQADNLTVETDDAETVTLVYDEVVQEFDPGDTLSFTVELSDFDSDRDGEATVTDEPQPEPMSVDGFVVDIISFNDPVEGEDLDITVEVTNQGDVDEDTQTINLDAGSLGTDSESVTLNASKSTTETLTVGTDAGDADAYEITVSSDDDSTEMVVTVGDPDNPLLVVTELEHAEHIDAVDEDGAVVERGVDIVVQSGLAMFVILVGGMSLIGFAVVLLRRITTAPSRGGGR